MKSLRADYRILQATALVERLIKELNVDHKPKRLKKDLKALQKILYELCDIIMDAEDTFKKGSKYDH